MSQNNVIQDSTRYLERLFTEGVPIKLLGAAATVATDLTLRIPHIYKVALAFFLFDLVTGIAKARITKTNSSDAGKQGAVKFTIYLVLLIVADLGGQMTGGMIGRAIPIAAFFLVGHTETTSVAENLQAITKHLRVKVPGLDGFIRFMRINNPNELVDAASKTLKTLQTGKLSITNQEGGPDA